MIRSHRRHLPTPAEFEAEATEAARKKLARLAQGRRPVVVGPWTSEVGFELLYWIPFLRWAARAFELDPERLVAFSRGGVSCWYRGICDGGYADVLELRTADAFREAVDARAAAAGGQKQGTVGQLDRALVREAVRAGRLPAKHDLLHPSLMYELFRLSWKGGTSVRHVLEHTVHEPLARPDPPGALPDGTPYTAAKFYYRKTFPETDGNREFVRRAVRRLASLRPVVLLSTGHRIDEHADVDPGEEESVRRPLVGVDASRNLEAQTGVIADAALFVGTYGGLSYLALSYGIPSVSIVSHPQQLLPYHHLVASRAADRLGTPLSLVDSSHAAAVGAVCAPVIAAA